MSKLTAENVIFISYIRKIMQYKITTFWFSLCDFPLMRVFPSPKMRISRGPPVIKKKFKWQLDVYALWLEFFFWLISFFLLKVSVFLLWGLPLEQLFENFKNTYIIYTTLKKTKYTIFSIPFFIKKFQKIFYAYVYRSVDEGNKISWIIITIDNTWSDEWYMIRNLEW